MEAGGMVANALEISEYARKTRSILHNGLVELAADMTKRGKVNALAMSHAPLSELAVPNEVAAHCPYYIGETDTVIYTVEDGVVTGSELVKAPEIDLG